MVHNKDMKKALLISVLFLSASVFAYPENEAEFLYGKNHNNQPDLLNYGNGHTYTSGYNDTYYRDDSVRYKKDISGMVESDQGERYMPITNPISNETYYIRTH